MAVGPRNAIKIAIYLFVTCYGLIKGFLGVPHGTISKKPFLIRFLIQAGLISLTMMVIFLFILCAIFFQVLLWGVDLYLKLKLGDNYGGRLDGQDVQFEVADEKISMTALLILNHNDDQQIAIEHLQDLFLKFHHSCFKLSCTVRKCMGYLYYVKNQVTSEGCYRLIKVNDEEYLSKEYFMDYIQKNCMTNVLNGDRLWYGTIFSQPVLWNKTTERNKQLAIMITFRHCIADGISMISLLKDMFYSQEKTEHTKLDLQSTTPNFSLDNVHIYRNPLVCEQDKNAFEISKAERQIAFFTENEIKYVPLVKEIKAKLCVGFTDILIACLTASFAEILSKRGKTMEKYTIGILFRPLNEDLLNIINGTYDYTNISNDSTIAMITVPFTMNKESTMTDRIKAVGLEVQKAKRSADTLFFYTLAKFAYLAPTVIMKPITEYFLNVSVITSNVGGLRDGTIAGYKVEAALAYVPFGYENGFRFTIFTLGDRFQLGLMANEGLLYDRNEAQIVLNGLFKHIDSLYEELERKDK